MTAPFTTEQEARIREIVAEERKARGIAVGRTLSSDVFNTHVQDVHNRAEAIRNRAKARRAE